MTTTPQTRSRPATMVTMIDSRGGWEYDIQTDREPVVGEWISFIGTGGMSYSKRIRAINETKATDDGKFVSRVTTF